MKDKNTKPKLHLPLTPQLVEQLGRVLAQQSGGGEEGKWRGRERLEKLLRNVLGAAARVGRAQELLHNPIAALQVMSSEIMPMIEVLVS